MSFIVYALYMNIYWHKYFKNMVIFIANIHDLIAFYIAVSYYNLCQIHIKQITISQHLDLCFQSLTYHFKAKKYFKKTRY